MKKEDRIDIVPTPSFVRPFLYALNRMQANEVLRPSQYLDRARTLLMDRLGMVGGKPKSAFSNGVVGIMSDHTHYFDGFALVLSLRQGVAVAVRANTLGRHRIVLEGYHDVVVDDTSELDDSELSRLFTILLDTSQTSQELHYDVSIVGSIPTGLGAAFHGALVVSLVRALHDAAEFEISETEIRNLAQKVLNSWYGHRFSPSYIIGSMVTNSDSFLLIDTGTMSHLPVVTPVASKLGWGVVEWTKDWIHPFNGVEKRNNKAHKVLQDLQGHGYPQIKSLRNLEHRDLEQALDSIPKRSRATLRYLVTENRNVQKMVLAIRKADWQFFGALMMISQASKTHDWSTTDAIHELITKEAESAALEGIFGVVQSGEGGCMLVFGQPFSLPAFLDKAKEIASSHTSEQVSTFII